MTEGKNLFDEQDFPTMGIQHVLEFIGRSHNNELPAKIAFAAAFAYMQGLQYARSGSNVLRLDAMVRECGQVMTDITSECAKVVDAN